MTQGRDLSKIISIEEIVVDRILVIDDEENVLLTIAAILEQEGYRVETANSGEQAIEKLTNECFDLVLTDLRMDKVSGINVLDYIHLHTPSTVSIVLTGYASFESAIAALRQSAYDYLIKPCIIEDLKHTVRRGLERRRLELIAKQRERQLELINRELERMVEERTRELAAANTELKEKNQQIENFVYVVSHDLRSPIVSIQGLTGVLLEEYNDKLTEGEGLNYLELIQKSAGQMSALIDDLLQFSRVGRAHLNISEVDCERLVREVWTRFDSINHGVVLEIKTRLPIIQADVHKVAQILSNLFDNAIKYRGDIATPKVEIICEESETNWHFTISNNGIGFDPCYREKIFEPFQRLSDVHDMPGSGIGLPIVRKIAQLHGGHAWADGQINKGSAFHFTIAKSTAARAATAE
ncbi:MAG: response regulator [Acidobacteriota bacterium]